MKTPTHHSRGRRLERAMIAFFILAALSLLVVYVADPAIYAHSLALTSSPTDRYPVPVTLFLIGILTMIALLILGVMRHWCWLFWLILLAFTGSVIQIPVEGFQLMGIVPNPYPVWYSLFRGAVGFIELGFAFWMFQTYRHHGVWAMGRKKEEQVSKVILQNAATNGSYASGMIRFGSYVVFNPLSERWFWAAFRGLARVAPQAALKSMLPGLSRLPPDQVLATMSPVQQQAALAFLLASRSGSGFLHDIHHHCGDLGRITAPVLIITSKYDSLVDSSHATYAHNHIPQAQLFVSEAESHLMWFSSHDDEIRAKMQAFLRS